MVSERRVGRRRGEMSEEEVPRKIWVGRREGERLRKRRLERGSWGGEGKKWERKKWFKREGWGLKRKGKGEGERGV